MAEEPERAPVFMVIEACAKIVAKRITHDECRQAMTNGQRVCRKCRQFEEIVQELYVLMKEW